MCNVNCCCANVQTKYLKLLLYIFTFINIVLSFIAIFIRAAKTGRYNDALLVLEERNRDKLSNYKLDKCILSGTFKDDLYCEINGKMLYKPSENVSYQSLFRNYVKVELAINVLRTIITVIFFAFIYFIFTKYNLYQLLNTPNRKEEKEKLSNLLMLSFGYLIILLFTSALFILIRAFALSANMDIGLYEDGKQNEFEDHTVINYIIDIFNIILNGIAIWFVLRIKRDLNKEQNPIRQPSRPIAQPIYQQPYVSTDRYNQNQFQNFEINQNQFQNAQINQYQYQNVQFIQQVNIIQNNDSNNMRHSRPLPPIENRNNTPNPNYLPSRDEV